MTIACLVVLGMLLAGGKTASAQGMTGGDVVSAQETYKGPMGTEEHPVRVSGGVMAGLILHKVDPVYPQEALDAGVWGAVVMEAKLDKTGKIVDLKLISGPEVMREASLAAVREWTYKPYQLNGQPVFVQTTVTVMFTMQH